MLQYTPHERRKLRPQRHQLTPGLCVDVPGGVKPGPGNQAPQLQLWACSGGPNQEWDPVCE